MLRIVLVSVFAVFAASAFYACGAKTKAADAAKASLPSKISSEAK